MARILLHPVGFQVGNIGVIKLSYLWYIEVSNGHGAGGSPFNIVQRLRMNRSELAEIDFRYGRHAGTTAGSAALHTLFYKGVDVFFLNPSAVTAALNLRQISPQLARQFAHRRAGVNAVIAARAGHVCSRRGGC